jgi:Uma2 family endonuclease
MSTAISPAFYSRRSYTKEHLPESDGKPMAETDKHRKQMIALLDALEEYYRPDPGIYVTGNILVHFRDEAGEWMFLAPDIFVVKGVEKKDRRSYVLEDEGKAPDLIIELVSPSSKVEDFGNKRVIYAGWGVKEYFLFDPTGELYSGPLRGFRLEGNEYVPMMGARLHSEVLGLDLVVERGRLRLYDPKTGKYLLTHEESEAARRAAEEKAAQEEAARRAAEEKAASAEAKAEQEYAARQAAEAELARLREELAKLRGQKS